MQRCASLFSVADIEASMRDSFRELIEVQVDSKPSLATAKESDEVDGGGNFTGRPSGPSDERHEATVADDHGEEESIVTSDSDGMPNLADSSSEDERPQRKLDPVDPDLSAETSDSSEEDLSSTFPGHVPYVAAAVPLPAAQDHDNDESVPFAAAVPAAQDHDNDESDDKAALLSTLTVDFLKSVNLPQRSYGDITVGDVLEVLYVLWVKTHDYQVAELLTGEESALLCCIFETASEVKDVSRRMWVVLP